MFKSLHISASALTAERLRMDIISNNIANVNTTKTADGGPYQRQTVLYGERANYGSFSQKLRKEINGFNGGGVEVLAIQKDNSPFKRVYDPQHPDSDQDGFVNLPNVDVMKEMVDMISTTRSYEANISVLNSSKSMLLKALEIGRG